MDLKMKAENISVSGITWDCKVTNGIVPIISGDEEDIQCATIAVFLIVGSVPQLPNVGVPWTKYLTKEITFGELDFYVRDSLQKVDKNTYYPQYNIKDEQLIMSVGKMEDQSEL